MFMEKFEDDTVFRPVTVSITFETPEELIAIMTMASMSESVANVVFDELTRNQEWFNIVAFLSILKDTLEQ